ncbi:hypothetical protein BH11PAT4_BH11PAT4_1290 [soil metagenome]
MQSNTHIPAAVLSWWKQRRKRHRLAVYVLIIALVTLSAPTVIRKASGVLPRTAEFYFLEPGITYITGQTFAVELRVRTGEMPINAMGFTIDFDPTKLEVQRMTTDKSFCTLFTDNIFDNQRGTITVSCGRPTPGFSGDSIATKVTFRAKVPGITTISVDESSSLLLANDGKGSNISKEAPKLNLTIQQF